MPALRQICFNTRLKDLQKIQNWIVSNPLNLYDSCGIKVHSLVKG
mgnify:CR=1 FL=1